MTISKETALCERYMGKYPVIFISLKGVDGLNFEEACGTLRRIIRAEASHFRMLLSSEKIADEDGYYEEMISLIRGLFGQVQKGQ